MFNNLANNLEYSFR